MMLKLHAFEVSMKAPCEVFCYICTSGSRVDNLKWGQAMRYSMQYWQVSCAGKPFHMRLTKLARDGPACSDCGPRAPEQFDQAYRDSAPDFPL